MAKLIILRGPSGAGKSTVSELLKQRVATKLGVFEQDHYRHGTFNRLDIDNEVGRHAMFGAVQATLEYGTDVVMEGIMNKAKYEPYFNKLFKDHPDENYFFYFDVSAEETVRRHATRSKSQHISDQEMLSWYGRAGRFDYPGEVIIPQDCSAEQAFEKIIAVTGLAVVA
ncbi:MAG TPA: AAA family ATPase [Ktedonobacteraceae bacterium]|nr:AAA family ATPase [Ktedonobacteraceae bacterium]